MNPIIESGLAVQRNEATSNDFPEILVSEGSSSVRDPERILHISNTDIASDSRILKELIVIKNISNATVFAFGVPNGRSKENSSIDGIIYFQQVLFFRRLTLLPRAVRYFFEIFEFTIRAIILARKIRPTVVHCHDAFALPTGYFANVLFGSILIYDAHELESDKNGQNAILSSCTLWIEKFSWKKVDLFISVSGAIIEWYMKELGAKNNILVLNSPEISSSSPESYFHSESGRYFHRKYDIPADRRVFVYLGILAPGRGIETIVTAFADSGVQAHVVFIGFGPLESEIREYSRKFGNVHLHEPVTHNQVVPLVRNADFGLCLIENVSLSDYYCLPNKLFEYAFAGLPVLASNLPEIERIVSTYSLGQCCDTDFESVRQAIADLAARGPGKISSALTELSWGSQAARLSLAYQDLLRGRIG